MTVEQAINISIENIRSLPLEEIIEAIHLRDQFYFDTITNIDASTKNAYELAVENGFVGDLTAWLESLKGDDAIIDYTVLLEELKTDPSAFIDAIDSTTAKILGIDAYIGFNKQNVIGFTSLRTDRLELIFSDSSDKQLPRVELEDKRFTMTFDKQNTSLKMT